MNAKKENPVQSFYGNKLRVRVCGICVHDEKLLFVNHSSITDSNFWAPPGGGLNFGERAQDCLKREFMEETGIEIEVHNFLFACELIKNQLHGIELFFKVKPITFQTKIGNDPEVGSPSIIKNVEFKSWDEIQKIPHNELHGIFAHVTHPSKIDKLLGYFML